MPPGLDPREDYEPAFLLEVATKDAPGEPYELPSIPVEALLGHLRQFSEDVATPLQISKGFIDAEVLGTHTAIRGVAESLRRDLVHAAEMYDRAGKKVTPEIRAFVQAAQQHAKSSLSNVRMSTSSYRLLTEKGLSLQFGNVERPWAKNVRAKLSRPPVQLYDLKQLAKNPEAALNRQAYYKNSQSVLVMPKGIARALEQFDKVLVAAEIAPSVYEMYTAVNDGDYETAFKKFASASAIVGGKIVGDIVTRGGLSICVETGIEVTVVASPAVGLPFTVACGVAAVAAGIYVGDSIKTLPTNLSPVIIGPGPLP